METPRAPGDLRAVARGSEIELSWKDQSDGETAFLVERSMDGSAFTTVARTAANAAGWVDEHLPGDPSRQLWYRVRAADFDGPTLGAFCKPVMLKVSAAK